MNKKKKANESSCLHHTFTFGNSNYKSNTQHCFYYSYICILYIHIPLEAWTISIEDEHTTPAA